MSQPTRAKDIISDPENLLDWLDASHPDSSLSKQATTEFPFKTTHTWIEQIKQGDPDDPLLRQILPVIEEEQEMAGFVNDPVGDLHATAGPGILHKYQGRVLLTVTGACAIHCRYCFRRHFPYQGANPLKKHWPKTLEYLRGDHSISEVILSGGDPLTLSDERLSQLITDLAGIDHLKRLRIHSRVPVVQPERITQELLSSLTKTRLKSVMVLHINHGNELGTAAGMAIHKMKNTGIPLFNQSVLLKGVNDNVDILVELSEKLFEAGIVPYYLHMLDPVKGAAHFSVDENKAKALFDTMRKRLPGYLVPRLVKEIAGFPYKNLMASVLAN